MDARRTCAQIGAGLALLATSACGVPEARTTRADGNGAATEVPLVWARVDIPKALVTVAAIPALDIPEDAVPAEEVYPSPEPPRGPLITMEIVEDVSVPGAGEYADQPVPDNGKYVLVSIGEQHLYAYDNGELIYSFVASTGMGNSTRVGTFHVLDKIPNA